MGLVLSLLPEKFVLHPAASVLEGSVVVKGVDAVVVQALPVSVEDLENLLL